MGDRVRACFRYTIYNRLACPETAQILQTSEFKSYINATVILAIFFIDWASPDYK